MSVDRVKEVLASVFSVPAQSLDDRSSQDDIPGWDSVRHMTMVLALEEEFSVSFSDEQVTQMLNVGLVRLLTEEALAAQARE